MGSKFIPIFGIWLAYFDQIWERIYLWESRCASFSSSQFLMGNYFLWKSCFYENLVLVSRICMLIKWDVRWMPMVGMNLWIPIGQIGQDWQRARTCQTDMKRCMWRRKLGTPPLVCETVVISSGHMNDLNSIQEDFLKSRCISKFISLHQ